VVIASVVHASRLGQRLRTPVPHVGSPLTELKRRECIPRKTRIEMYLIMKKEK
jgi:hypothetical protein